MLRVDLVEREIMTNIRKFMICELVAILTIILTCVFLYLTPLGFLSISVLGLMYYLFRKLFYPMPASPVSNLGSAAKIYSAFLFAMLMCTTIAVLYYAFINNESKIGVYAIDTLLIFCIPYAIMAIVNDYKTAKQKDEKYEMS